MPSENGNRVLAGSLAVLERDGQIVTKVDVVPVVVVWHEGRAYAIEDRCPHMGFPLHEGTCEAGLLTCHWHHARFDLESGSTLDPWADDARAFDVDLDGDEVWVSVRARVTTSLDSSGDSAKGSRTACHWSSPRPSSGCSTPV